jgi:hypothetical protein
MPDELIDLWIFPHDFDVGAIALIAQARRTPPDLRAVPVSARDDVLTVQVAEGEPPSDPEMRLYVDGQGAFEILRREVWPGGRALLTLRAWARR